MQRIPIKVQDIFEFRCISDPRFSPDGKLASFLVTKIDAEENAYLTDIWILDVSRRETRQLSHTGKVTDYFWLDDRSIVTWERKNGKTDVYRWTMDCVQPSLLFTLSVLANKIRPLEKGQFAVTAYTYLTERDPRYEIITEAPYGSNGQGITSGRRNTLYLYFRDTDTLKPLTAPNVDTKEIVYRAGVLIYQATPWNDYLPYPYGPAFFSYSCSTGKVCQLTEVGRINSFSLCFWRDDQLLFSGIEGSPGKSMGQNSDLYTLDISTGKLQRFADVDMKIGYNGTGSDAKYGKGQGFVQGEDGAYFLAPLWDGTVVNRVDPDGRVYRNVTEDEGFLGSVESFDIHGRDLLCAKMERSGFVELYLNGEKVTTMNDRYIRVHQVVTADPIVFYSRDGVELHGFCLKPTGYVPGRAYPGILHIHGGPKTIFGDVFHHEMQLWASNGFFVFYCNPRGSDGRGRDFADIRGRWGTVDHTDIMDLTTAILEKYPDIDERRLGVCGGSYGGYMTNWIIGHTDRFAAACSQRSFSNMINFEYLSDIGLTNIRSEHLCSAEDDPGAMWDSSPLKYAPNCKTPTLFIQADQDLRCPAPDAIEMFSCLKRQGCPARLCLFHGEDHELSRSGHPDARIIRLQEILNWFQTYLCPSNT